MEVNTITADPINIEKITNFIVNPIVFILILLIIIAYFIFFRSLGNNDSSGFSDNTENSMGKKIMSIVIVVILVILIIINAFEYFFNINITAYFKDMISNKPKIDIVVDKTTFEPSPIPTIRLKKQVFNVPGNYYDYTNAKALCNAYGAKLATYKQLEDAYEDGGEWCNYGWSDGQMALFPTQQKTFDNLQKIEGHENDCGRPGINGGFMANPNIRFGVNCYGNKPKIKEEEEELMENTSPYPETKEDLVFQKQVDFWKNKIDEILVSPFNHDSWGSF